jgi:prevent-host-death family protein
MQLETGSGQRVHPQTRDPTTGASFSSSGARPPSATFSVISNLSILHMMRTANVSTLRARLSELLDLVREGETIEILDRSLPVARLVPVRPATEPKARIPPWLERRRRAGVVRVGPMKGVPMILKKLPPGPPSTGALQALLDERKSGR